MHGKHDQPFLTSPPAMGAHCLMENPTLHTLHCNGIEKHIYSEAFALHITLQVYKLQKMHYVHWTAPCALQTLEGAPGMHQKW